jgi:superoxide dismutase, Fe-Mn family
MKYVLPQLPYAFDALSPSIDAKTMEIHYTKHHQGYIDKLNTALEKYPEMAEKTLQELLHNLDAVPEAIRTDIKNQGGGHENHSFFWTVMKKGGSEIKGPILDEIKQHFGLFSSFQEQFARQALSIFGSGWAWLVVDKNGVLKIITTANQDSPISAGLTPILGLDIWEHAYYLLYQNKRGDYISAWWDVVHWGMVQEYYDQWKKTR